MKRCLSLTALSLGLFALDAAAQPPGGGGGGMGMGMGMRGGPQRPSQGTRFMWMTFCFELSPTDAQVVKAWPIFQETFTKQKKMADMETQRQQRMQQFRNRGPGGGGPGGGGQ